MEEQGRQRRSLSRNEMEGVAWGMSDYIKPDPVLLSGLSGSCHGFKLVFTSDYVWQKLDVYGVGEGIHADFMRRLLPEHAPLMRLVWGDHLRPGDCRLDVTKVENLFFQLGYLLGSTPAEPRPFHVSCMNALDHNFVKVYIELGGSCELLGKHAGDSEVALMACKKDARNFNHFDDKVRSDPVLLRRLLEPLGKEECSPGWLPRSLWFSYRYSDGAFIQLAAELAPRALVYQLVRQEGWGAWESEVRRHLIPRVLLLGSDARREFFRGCPTLLDLFEEFWDEEEVCRAALHRETATEPHFLTEVGPFKFVEGSSLEVQNAALDYHPINLLAVPREMVPKGLFVQAVKLQPKKAKQVVEKAGKTTRRTEEFIAAVLEHTRFDADLLRRCGWDAVGALWRDPEWMRKRLSVSPRAFLSFPNKWKNCHMRDMLQTALEVQEALGSGGCSTGSLLEPQLLEFQDHSLPEMDPDSKLLKQVARVLGVRCIPKHLQSLDNVLYSLAKRGVNSPKDLEGIEEGILMTLVREFPRLFIYCSMDIQALYLHKCKVEWGMGQMLYLPGFPPLSNPMEWEEVAKYYEPGQHKVLPFPLTVEFVAAAVRYDGRRFCRLPIEFQVSKEVQAAIGSGNPDLFEGGERQPQRILLQVKDEARKKALRPFLPQF